MGRKGFPFFPKASPACDVGIRDKACLCVADTGLFPQVAMGYSHSLVIARDESEAEKEKLQRLPEYTPRTL